MDERVLPENAEVEETDNKMALSDAHHITVV